MNGDPRGEGYTDEGAFALGVYKHTLDRQGQLCEAEEMYRVLLHLPLDAFADEIPNPPADPAAQHERDSKLIVLQAQLQKQLNQSAAAHEMNVQLPNVCGAHVSDRWHLRRWCALRNSPHRSGPPPRAPPR